MTRLRGSLRRRVGGLSVVLSFCLSVRPRGSVGRPVSSVRPLISRQEQMFDPSFREGNTFLYCFKGKMDTLGCVHPRGSRTKVVVVVVVFL